MIKKTLSKITCIVDSNLSHSVEQALIDMAIPEAFIQRSKQVALHEKNSIIGISKKTVLAEAKSDIFRLYVPEEFEAAVSRRIAEAADLYLPGHGTLFAETVDMACNKAIISNTEKLESLFSSKKYEAPTERYVVICCIVQRDMAADLAKTIAEMGLCVPIISYGKGMGLRNRLGLLRITIPVEKEILYFIVPERDAEMIESIAVNKARLDIPGQGFLYSFFVRVYAINLRVRLGGHSHAASMEQVILALDDINGSSEWRRLAAKPKAAHKSKKNSNLSCLSLIADEGTVEKFVRAAMDAGAGGATVVPLTRRSYDGQDIEIRKSSNAKESCDLIIDNKVLPNIMGTIHDIGLYSDDVHGVSELSNVIHAVTYFG